jgi:hypothetical protein
MHSSSAALNSEGNCERQELCTDPKNCLNSENKNGLSSSQNSSFLLQDKAHPHYIRVALAHTGGTSAEQTMTIEISNN